MIHDNTFFDIKLESDISPTVGMKIISFERMFSAFLDENADERIPPKTEYTTRMGFSENSANGRLFIHMNRYSRVSKFFMPSEIVFYDLENNKKTDGYCSVPYDSLVGQVTTCVVKPNEELPHGLKTVPSIRFGKDFVEFSLCDFAEAMKRR